MALDATSKEHGDESDLGFKLGFCGNCEKCLALIVSKDLGTIDNIFKLRERF